MLGSYLMVKKYRLIVLLLLAGYALQQNRGRIPVQREKLFAQPMPNIFLSNMNERSRQIEEIRQLFQRSEDLGDPDENSAEELFSQAETAAEKLGLTDTEVRQLIASTIADPESRSTYTKLYIECPALPGETIFDHAERALGKGRSAGLQAAIKRWKGQQAFGFPPDYQSGIVE